MNTLKRTLLVWAALMLVAIVAIALVRINTDTPGAPPASHEITFKSDEEALKLLNHFLPGRSQFEEASWCYMRCRERKHSREESFDIAIEAYLDYSRQK